MYWRLGEIEAQIAELQKRGSMLSITEELKHRVVVSGIGFAWMQQHRFAAHCGQLHAIAPSQRVIASHQEALALKSQKP